MSGRDLTWTRRVTSDVPTLFVKLRDKVDLAQAATTVAEVEAVAWALV